ncbi:hypothetical protein [Candidatus Methylocalor cossyra]|uniref:DUF4328 domain-containing protein n=1 Tax=Candidatus Methylocalor cossyra TaxID=3108543 RepID=A0ABP1C5S7_9GAMM
MLGGLVVIAIAYWFYRSAEARGLPNFHWAFAGVLSFYIPNFIWALAVAKPWVASLHEAHATTTAGLINHSSVLVGLICAVLVHRFFLLNAPKPQ